MSQKLINIIFAIVVAVLLYAYCTKGSDNEFKKQDQVLISKIDSLESMLVIMEQQNDSLYSVAEAQGLAVDSAEIVRLANIQPQYVFIDSKYENTEAINSAVGHELDSIISDQLRIFRDRNK